MNRRDFVIGFSTFLTTISVIKQLPEISTTPSVVWPNTEYQLNDIYDISWTGFKQSIDSSCIAGNWLAYPRPKYANTHIFPAYCRVICWNEDGQEIKNWDVQNGLNTLLNMLDKGIKLAEKYNLKGCVPMNLDGSIDRKMFSQMRREQKKLGVL